jgi:tRNA-specific 2-thiouridylase
MLWAQKPQKYAIIRINIPKPSYINDYMNIAVLLSGGVDSSVSLRLLHEQGHRVTAFYLKIWLEDELAFLGDCPWDEDLRYARAVCEQIGVELKVVSLQKEYWDYVVSYVIDEVKAGRTPNPDVFCNKQIKFGMFLEYLNREHAGEFDKIASGHYAHIEYEGARARLMQTPDPIKDQTYFLSYLTQEQLQELVFPIGRLAKHEVRVLAQQFDLPNKDRKDSQGICFLGKLKFSDFIKQYLGEEKGDMIEVETGEIKGSHNGFWFYTIGQRQGLGLGGGPWYVVAKDAQANRIYISKDYHADDKQRDTFIVHNMHWISGKATQKMKLEVKLRHGAHKHACVINPTDDGRYLVQLASRDQGIAAGQFAVFYDGNECLGAGIIEQAFDQLPHQREAAHLSGKFPQA